MVAKTVATMAVKVVALLDCKRAAYSDAIGVVSLEARTAAKWAYELVE